MNKDFNQDLLNYKKLFSKIGAWAYLIGSLLFYIAISYSTSTWSIILITLALALILADLFLFYYKSEEGINLSNAIPWIFAIIAFLFYVLYNVTELPTEKLGGVGSSLVARFKLLFQFLYVIVYFASIVYRFMLSMSKGLDNTINSDFIIQKQDYIKKSWISIIAVFMLVVFLNYLGYLRNPTWDLSPNLYSFTTNSKVVIKSVKQKVKVYAFLPELQAVKLKETKFTPNELYRISGDVKLYLDQLSSINSNIEVKYYNADLVAYDINEFGGVNNGTIVIRTMKKENKSLSPNEKPYIERRVYINNARELLNIEKDLVRALINVASETKVIYLANGNGERNTVDSATNFAYSIEGLKEQLRFYNFKIENLDQKEGKFEIPKNADVLGLIGPLYKYGEVAKVAILDYLKNGGTVFATLASDTQAKAKGNTNSNNEDFSWLLESFGGKKYKFVNAVLTNTNMSGLLITDNIDVHPLTDNIKKLPNPILTMPQTGYFEEAKEQAVKKTTTAVNTIKTANPNKNTKSSKDLLEQNKKQAVNDLIELESSEVLHSPVNTFIDLNNNGKPDKDEGKGRLVLGLAFEKPKFPSSPRLAIFSGTDWLSEKGIRFPIAQYNLQMVTDTFLWLVESPLAGSISSIDKKVKSTQLSDELKWKLMFYGILIFPLLMSFGLGYLIYYYRNKYTQSK